MAITLVFLLSHALQYKFYFFNNGAAISIEHRAYQAGFDEGMRLQQDMMFDRFSELSEETGYDMKGIYYNY
ncbi:MAG: hypothetical protein ACFFE4_19600 [Candidatus Thorarchaeota archaeon]